MSHPDRRENERLWPRDHHDPLDVGQVALGSVLFAPPAVERQLQGMLAEMITASVADGCTVEAFDPSTGETSVVDPPVDSETDSPLDPLLDVLKQGTHVSIRHPEDPNAVTIGYAADGQVPDDAEAFGAQWYTRLDVA